MDQPAAALREQIANFEFDDPGTTFTLEQRLARENGWSVAFARRVLDEYRRFLLLAATAGHPISPSDAVDQAWHLHLTYTRSYWQRLCRDVLGFPLHHEPTRGGVTESAKFEAWYARTLASYRDIFGEAPPPDIWPPASAPERPRARHQRVDLASHWVLPRPRWASAAPRRWRVWSALGLAAAGVGCGTIYRTYPFTMTGPEFLPFFALFASALFVLAGLWRWHLSGPAPTASDATLPEEVDPYLLAYLAGGHARAVQAAVVALGARQQLRTDDRGGMLATGTARPEGHPLERAVHATLSTRDPQTLRSITLATQGLGSILQEDLEKRGWWLATEETRPARLRPLALALLVPVVGGLRAFQGLSRGYASEYIVILSIVSLILALVIFARRPGRSRAGSQVLRAQRSAHRAWRRRGTRAEALALAGAGAGAAMLPLAVGLFGSSVLAGTELDRLRRPLTPADTSSSGCSTSSGCGGGGGDGGGGGSGCGGCGGGGGD